MKSPYDDTLQEPCVGYGLLQDLIELLHPCLSRRILLLFSVDPVVHGDNTASEFGAYEAFVDEIALLNVSRHIVLNPFERITLFLTGCVDMG